MENNLNPLAMESKGWTLVNSITLPSDFVPAYPKDNSLIFVNQNYVSEGDNMVLYKTNSINDIPEKDRIIDNVPVFYVTYVLKDDASPPEKIDSEDKKEKKKIVTVDIDFDYNYMFPNKMYSIRLSGYDNRKHGFIYRPDKGNTIDHYEEII
jgi:hypothetical protein